MNDQEFHEMIEDARARALEEYNNLPWYQKNMDIAVPLFIIGIGLFQYILRKWIAPVPKDIIFELADQIPSQGLIFHPGFGAFLMIVGGILLVVFNLDHIFNFASALFT
jgi:hypothetical protein